MNLLQKKREELISVQASKNKLSKTSENTDDFDFDQWEKLTNQHESIEKEIEVLKDKQLADAKQHAEQAATQSANHVQTPINPTTNESHVTGLQPAYEQDKKLGFQCGGELLADAIAYAQHGSTLRGEKSDIEFQNKRFERYLQSTDSFRIDQAAGVASTLDDGIEIIPELLPGVREFGPGTFDVIMQQFSPVRSARKEIDYYINEDKYNVDGLVVARVNEGGQLTPQKFTNKLERLRLFKVGVFAAITEEDLQNVPLLESRYMRRAPIVIGVQKVQDIIDGSGVQQPIGFVTDNNTAALKVARGVATTITYTDLANMEKQFWRTTGNGVYFTNQSTLAQLVLLQDPSGALIWKENRNIGATAGPLHGTLNGRPLIVSEDMPQLGDVGDISLVNTDGYLFAEHTSGVRFAESLHFFFDTDKMALRWLSQYGGKPYFTKPYSPRKGGEDLSHFVLLDA